MVQTVFAVGIDFGLLTGKLAQDIGPLQRQRPGFAAHGRILGHPFGQDVASTGQCRFRVGHLVRNILARRSCQVDVCTLFQQ